MSWGAETLIDIYESIHDIFKISVFLSLKKINKNYIYFLEIN